MATRTVKMSENAVDNVKNVATYRLNKVLEALRVFGNCCGSNYDWKDEQIVKADQAILDAAEKAITQIREGKAIVDMGIQL